MNVKLRYVFLLTMMIVVIQIISFGTMYALFADYLASGTVSSVDDKLGYLRIIISAILAGSIIFTAFVSAFFVRETFMPIKKLGLEMQQVSFRNISDRLVVDDANDEISGVARNFNGVLDKMNAAFDFQKNFVFHASHEFRTPLAIMLSETESALSKELAVEDYKKVLVSLKEEQQELIELTNSLLLISQSEDMGYVSDWPMLRIDEVVYDTISYAKKMLPGLSIDMAFGELPDNPENLVIQGNERLLRSAFINLIKNAYMYSIDQKVNILLESSGDTIMVHFDNLGTQLPADEKRNLLVPFFRGSNALKTKGYGLGLPIVHRFISIHRGTVVYTPISNDINRFTVTLTKARSNTA
jgi:signal transduction histidine kinase